ncbi:MAG: non-ribosomal peptide synthetase, partial [Acidobacteria bacterium]|nr:non-ribosomal peptide synthetase [Acidobacteriota bacterium]
MTQSESKVCHPLSAAQNGILLAQVLDPISPQFNIGQYVSIQGRIEPVLFERAVRLVVEEADMLRVRLVEQDDGQRQIIDPLFELSMPFGDVSSESDPEAAAIKWMKSDLTQTTDLARGPLFASILFQIAADKFFWYLRCHHIITDGYGGGLFIRRVAEVYTAIVAGVPVQQGRYSRLENLLEEDRNYRASEQFQRDRQYWLNCMADCPVPVTLSTRAALTSGVAGPEWFLRRSAYLSGPTTASLRLSKTRRGADLPAMVAATLAAYLYRLTNTRDLVLGLPVTGRIGALARETPGMFSNVLPLRVFLHGNMRIVELVEQIAVEIGRSLRRQRYRFEDLRRDLGLLAHHNRLFGPTINVMRFDRPIQFAGCCAALHNLSNGPVDDLSFVIYDQSDNGQLRIDFDANPTLYTPEELDAHQERFLRLLEGIARNPEQRIRDIELLSAGERQQVVVEWNATAVEYERDECVHELVEAQA